MKLIAITGLDNDFKRAAVERLASALTAAGQSVSIVDNNDSALKLSYPTWRLPGGCACCTLAYGLIDVVERLDTDIGLIAVAGAAVPDALRYVLNSLRSTARDVLIVALVTPAVWELSAYYAAQLTTHADLSLSTFAELDEVAAALAAP